MEDEDTPNPAYWSHYRDDINSLHPSCGVTTPTPETVATPMETEDATQEDRETETTVRVITYREERGGRDNNRGHHGNRDRNTGRGDRERRRGMPRQEGRRDRNRRDQERAREEARRQRDRGDRANRERRGPRKD